VNLLNILCGNNFMVLKAAPPLVISEAQLDEFVAAIRDVVALADSSPTLCTAALALARRAAKI
jgi:ornithine--oxo-acid transaminase